MTLLVEPNPRTLYANIIMYECGHRTPLRSWWAPQRARPLATNVARGSREPASARCYQSPASKRSSRNPSPTTSRTRKTQKAMDSVCDASLAQCRGDAVEAA